MSGRLAMAVLLLATVLGTGAPSGAGAEQIGILTEKDVARRTVTIDGQVYSVSSRLVIVGQEGEPLEFRELPVAVFPNVEFVYAYEVVETPTGRVVTRLEMREVPD